MSSRPLPLARVASLMLHLRSKSFRDEYGATIVSDFSALLRAEQFERGSFAMLRLWGRGLVDLMRAPWRETPRPPRGGLLTDLGSDVRHIARSWRRSRAVAITVLCTLALGLGLAAAIFSFADGYLFRPLPFPDAEQLYRVRDPKGKIASSLTAADVARLRHTDVATFGFAEWNAGRLMGNDLEVDDRRVEIESYDVSPGFVQTLRMPLAAGRAFEERDHLAVDPVPALISDKFWRREFNRDVAVLGRSFTVAGATTTRVVIIGVMPPGFASLDLNNPPPDLVLPHVAERVLPPNYLSFPIVRLPDGMSREEGEARIAAALQGVAPAPAGETRVVQLRPLRDSLVANGKPTARVLFSGAMLILLLVAINVIHLLLAQGVRRADEIATRAALGASRWRIVRLFAVESALLGALGIGGGLLLGAWLSSVIAASVPEFPSGGRNLALVPMLFDGRVIAFAVVLGAIVACVGAAWPAWRALRSSLLVSQRSATGLTASISARTSRFALASELAVATVIMLGTVFIGVGISRYLNQPLGFSYHDRLWVTVRLPAGSDTPDEQARVGPELRKLVAGISGVRAAGPESAESVRQPVFVRGEAVADAQALGVTAGYFDAWQSQVRAGRLFAPDEYRLDEPVAIVDASFARRVWTNADPLGQELRIGDGTVRKVVGVLEPQVRRLDHPPEPVVYVALPAQQQWWRILAWAPGLTADDLVTRLTPSVNTLIPGANVSASPVEFEWLFNRQTGEATFQAPIMTAFGILAFALAGIGVFGLVSYIVAQRTREFGIRLALGARQQDVWRGVFRESFAPSAAGLAVGVAAAWALERLIRSSVFGWESSGFIAVVVVSAALLCVALVAAVGPARRVLRIDPAIVLRSE